VAQDRGNKNMTAYLSGSTATGVWKVPKTGATVSYADGDDFYHNKGKTPTTPRFTAMASPHENCILDNFTGLIWAKDANQNGQNNWVTQLAFVNSLDYGGFTDWRLPNIKEFESIVDRGQYDPCLPSGHPFVNVITAGNLPSTTDHYWSGTTCCWGITPQNPVFPGTAAAWVMQLFDGYESTDLKTLTTGRVWPVRGN